MSKFFLSVVYTSTTKRIKISWPCQWMNIYVFSVCPSRWNGLIYIEGFRPQWLISTMIYSQDILFWLETLKMQVITPNTLDKKTKNKKKKKRKEKRSTHTGWQDWLLCNSSCYMQLIIDCNYTFSSFLSWGRQIRDMCLMQTISITN